MLTQIFSYIGSFLNFRSNSAKRQRSDSDEFYPATFTPSPRKRLRLTDLMADNIGPPKSAVGTQTRDETFVVTSNSPIKGPRGFYDSQSKENWDTPQSLIKLTPRKGLSSSFYKSPTRSPRSSQPVHDSSDAKCVGVFRNPSSSRQILAAPSSRSTGKIIKAKTRPKLKTNLLHPRTLAKTEAIVRDNVDMDCKEAYSKLLGAFMKHTKAEVSKQAVIDLTSEEKEEIDLCVDRLKYTTPEVVDLTRDLRGETKMQQKKKNVSNVICIDDSDDDVIEVKPAEKVTKINSMQSKIKQVQCSSPTWLDAMLEKHTKAMRDIRLESERREKEKEVSAANLHSEIEKLFVVRSKKHMTITSVPVLDEKVEPAKLPELTPSMQDKIAAWLSMHGSADEILVEKFNYQIRRRDLRTLRGLSWLNDEVINFYMNLIMDRSKQNSNYPKSYCFNTFFYMKLLNGGHGSVKRWTRKVDVFSYDILIVPVHLKVHWCLAAIDFKKKLINYYDSMNGSNEDCLHALERYLLDERKEKKGEEFSTKGWQLINVKGIPQQMNGSDCGMFACTFAEYLARGAEFTFSQTEMPYFRNKMAYEIVTGELLIKK